VVAWVTGLVNEQNGQLDDAIKNFKLILSDEMNENPNVKNRGFDFRRDFEVWNRLGIVQVQRAANERDNREAVSSFEKTLAIDPENETAHFNLSLLFRILAGGAGGPGESAERRTGDQSHSQRVTATELLSLARDVTVGERSSELRVAAAEQLARLIPVFLASERDRFESKHAVLIELLGKCRPVYSRSHELPIADATLAEATARVLHVLHRELHQIYKPDDNARAVVATHRQQNPAANHAAQSIVIYPLNRPGAPGLANSHTASERPTSGGGL
jgi:hypothetical protein